MVPVARDGIMGHFVASIDVVKRSNHESGAISVPQIAMRNATQVIVIKDSTLGIDIASVVSQV